MSLLEQASFDAARNFLRTVAVFDDGEVAGTEPLGPPPDAEVITPPTLGSEGAQDTVKGNANQDRSSGENDADDQQIDIQGIQRGASELGIMAALVHPKDAHHMDVLHRADICVLDWRIENDRQEGESALNVLEELLERTKQGGQQEICIYSLTPDFEAGVEKIYVRLDRLGLNPDRDGLKIMHDKGIVVWRRKYSTGGPEHYSSPEDLVKYLVDQFSSQHKGLVPILALYGLASVRDNVKVLLDRYCSEADAGYIFDRIALPFPHDVDSSLSEAIAEDTAVLILNALEHDPIDKELFEEWLNQNLCATGVNKEPLIVAQIYEPNPDFTASCKSIARACYDGTKRVDDKEGSRIEPGHGLVNRDAKKLIERFRHSLEESANYWALLLSSELAMNADNVPLGPGCILRSKNEYLVCIQPACDSVRLEKPTRFLFQKMKVREFAVKIQGIRCVVGTVSKTTILDVKANAENLVTYYFNPDTVSHRVTLVNGKFCAVNHPRWRVRGREFEFLGKLRFAHSQRLLQKFSDDAGRVGLSESEFHRLKR